MATNCKRFLLKVIMDIEGKKITKNDEMLSLQAKYNLPAIEGEYRFGVILAKTNWFGIGGCAEILFKPKDAKDLANFVKNKPKDLPMIVIGVGSNLLVRDGGVNGVVVKLGRGFTEINYDGEYIVAGAGVLCQNLAKFAKENEVTGFEFMIGIPGTVGGALAMNAGAYGSEIVSINSVATIVDHKGDILEMSAADIGFVYRGNSLPKNSIFTSGKFIATKGNKNEIETKMQEITAAREKTQPVKTRTSGSTFKNPSGLKAWQLIDEAGCRGLRIGDAVVSELHCNFFINLGAATAKDVENLGAEVIRRVKAKTGIDLVWEVKIIGKNL